MRVAQLVARVGQRQLAPEQVDFAEVEVGGHPAAEEDGLSRHVRGDVRVAVAIAPDPRAEADRRDLERQAGAGVLGQGPVQLAQVARQRLPQRLLEHQQAAADLVERRRPDPPDLVGLPAGGNLAAQRLDDGLPLPERQVRAVLLGQGAGDAVVLLQQRAADDLGRVGGQHQLDLERADGIAQVGGRQPGRDQPAERLLARAALRRQVRRLLVGAAAADPVVLLGDVGEVQELREGARHRQDLVHRHPAELGRQRVEGAGVARAAGLGEGADALHQGEALLPFPRADRLPEQLAEQPDVVAQGLVGIGRSGHEGSVSRSEGPRPPKRVASILPGHGRTPPDPALVRHRPGRARHRA